MIIENFELWSGEIMELVCIKASAWVILCQNDVYKLHGHFLDVMLVFIYTLKSTMVWHRFQKRSESVILSRIRVDVDLNTSGSLVAICVPFCL